ncbi:putative subtilase-type serine protease precursor [Anaerohalosphaera lusitana]|uniref:Putative subtilase-type serine protease n=1 Tax=Anaerohalosphaera lusitana TaxID=1936003 RepID=A0A1U9NK36_9BACT|nr:pre-peptidase C-terminal domain-containing protein [Anaerohalosphaera lusitana]AQT67876.1 putative subtilase-type serine protease precursor [Anaerohalosphaera lusitana]
MKHVRFILVGVFCFACSAWGVDRREPHVGYVYPAGGQRGKVVRAAAGGQFLWGAKDVHVSGEGVHAKVIKHMRPVGNLNKEKREAITAKLKEVRDMRLAEVEGKKAGDKSGNKEGRKAAKVAKDQSGKGGEKAESDKEKKGKAERSKMPEHPLLYDVEDCSLRELAHIRDVLFMPRFLKQQNRQLAESVLIKIEIDEDAEPGPRELRIGTGLGLTNPVIFEVGLGPDVYEQEPNDKEAMPELKNYPKAPKGKVVELPAVLNGQIMPGDVDRFRFRAKKGQKLVVDTHARRLVPYLADAVPGWFQAVVTIYDARGNEVVFADDYRFSPDPVLLWEVERSGEYELEIRDAIHRGREDFVYRISVGEQPFITHMFPLGGQVGKDVTAEISGWNLATDELKLDTSEGGGVLRQTCYRSEGEVSNAVPYLVSELPSRMEKEDNGSRGKAQKLEIGVTVDGRIGKAGDVDVYRFEGRAGERVAIEVFARRLNSPMDAVVRLMDASGEVIAWNDDHVVKGDEHLHKNASGMLTHHADPYLTAELSKDGDYFVEVEDVQQHGGEAYAYRLRVERATGDFALRVVPASINVRTGFAVPVWVYVLRKDGYSGPIDISVKGDLGFELTGGRIPAGADRVCMSLRAGNELKGGMIDIEFEGSAMIGEETVVRTAVGAEDMMQAFLYRHLVPTQEIVAAVKKLKWKVPGVTIDAEQPLVITAGQSEEIVFKTRKRRLLNELRLDILNPPAGVSVEKVRVVDEGLACKVKCAEGDVQDFSGNLIFEMVREWRPKGKDGKPGKKRESSLGVLPAVPVEIDAKVSARS